MQHHNADWGRGAEAVDVADELIDLGEGDRAGIDAHDVVRDGLDFLGNMSLTNDVRAGQRRYKVAAGGVNAADGATGAEDGDLWTISRGAGSHVPNVRDA